MEGAADVTKKGSQPKDRLEGYIRLMEEEDLQELEISDGPFQLKLVRVPRQSAAPVHVAAPAPALAAESAQGSKPEPVEEGNTIKAPLGGVFYRSPSPKSPPYVTDGARIQPGQTLGIIEAMKVMNEIKSEMSGRIVKILIENGKPVEPNQNMFIVETE